MLLTAMCNVEGIDPEESCIQTMYQHVDGCNIELNILPPSGQAQAFLHHPP